jgi:hypothetical protein
MSFLIQDKLVAVPCAAWGFWKGGGSIRSDTTSYWSILSIPSKRWLGVGSGKQMTKLLLGKDEQGRLPMVLNRQKAMVRCRTKKLAQVNTIKQVGPSLGAIS